MPASTSAKATATSAAVSCLKEPCELNQSTQPQAPNARGKSAASTKMQRKTKAKTNAKSKAKAKAAATSASLSESNLIDAAHSSIFHDCAIEYAELIKAAEAAYADTADDYCYATAEHAAYADDDSIDLSEPCEASYEDAEAEQAHFEQAPGLDAHSAALAAVINYKVVEAECLDALDDELMDSDQDADEDDADDEALDDIEDEYDYDTDFEAALDPEQDTEAEPRSLFSTMGSKLKSWFKGAVVSKSHNKQPQERTNEHVASTDPEFNCSELNESYESADSAYAQYDSNLSKLDSDDAEYADSLDAADASTDYYDKSDSDDEPEFYDDSDEDEVESLDDDDDDEDDVIDADDLDGDDEDDDLEDDESDEDGDVVNADDHVFNYYTNFEKEEVVEPVVLQGKYIDCVVSHNEISEPMRRAQGYINAIRSSEAWFVAGDSDTSGYNIKEESAHLAARMQLSANNAPPTEYVPQESQQINVPAHYARVSTVTGQTYLAPVFSMPQIDSETGEVVAQRMIRPLMLTYTGRYKQFPILSDAEICGLVQGKIDVLKRLIAADADTKTVSYFLDPMIMAMIRLCNVLPASEFNHDSQICGLVDHNLKVAIFALTQFQRFDPVSIGVQDSDVKLFRRGTNWKRDEVQRKIKDIIITCSKDDEIRYADGLDELDDLDYQDEDDDSEDYCYDEFSAEESLMLAADQRKAKDTAKEEKNEDEDDDDEFRPNLDLFYQDREVSDVALAYWCEDEGKRASSKSSKSGKTDNNEASADTAAEASASASMDAPTAAEANASADEGMSIEEIMASGAGKTLELDKKATPPASLEDAVAALAAEGFESDEDIIVDESVQSEVVVTGESPYKDWTGEDDFEIGQSKPKEKAKPKIDVDAQEKAAQEAEAQRIREEAAARKQLMSKINSFKGKGVGLAALHSRNLKLKKDLDLINSLDVQLFAHGHYLNGIEFPKNVADEHAPDLYTEDTAAADIYASADLSIAETDEAIDLPFEQFTESDPKDELETVTETLDPAEYDLDPAEDLDADNEEDPEVEAEPELEADLDEEPETELYAEPDVQEEHAPEECLDSAPEAVLELEPEPEIELESDIKNESESVGETDLEAAAEDDLKTESESEHEEEIDSAPEMELVAEPEQCPEPESEPESEPEVEIIDSELMAAAEELLAEGLEQVSTDGDEDASEDTAVEAPAEDLEPAQEIESNESILPESEIPVEESDSVDSELMAVAEVLLAEGLEQVSTDGAVDASEDAAVEAPAEDLEPAQEIESNESILTETELPVEVHVAKPDQADEQAKPSKRKKASSKRSKSKKQQAAAEIVVETTDAPEVTVDEPHDSAEVAPEAKAEVVPEEADANASETVDAEAKTEAAPAANEPVAKPKSSRAKSHKSKKKQAATEIVVETTEAPEVTVDEHQDAAEVAPEAKADVVAVEADANSPETIDAEDKTEVVAAAEEPVVKPKSTRAKNRKSKKLAATEIVVETTEAPEVRADEHHDSADVVTEAKADVATPESDSSAADALADEAKTDVVAAADEQVVKPKTSSAKSRKSKKAKAANAPSEETAKSQDKTEPMAEANAPEVATASDAVVSDGAAAEAQDKAGAVAAVVTEGKPVKRKRGRPKGSKNKTTLEREAKGIPPRARYLVLCDDNGNPIRRPPGRPPKNPRPEDIAFRAALKRDFPNCEDYNPYRQQKELREAKAKAKALAQAKAEAENSCGATANAVGAEAVEALAVGAGAEDKSQELE